MALSFEHTAIISSLRLTAKPNPANDPSLEPLTPLTGNDDAEETGLAAAHALNSAKLSYRRGQPPRCQYILSALSDSPARLRLFHVLFQLRLRHLIPHLLIGKRPLAGQQQGFQFFF